MTVEEARTKLKAIHFEYNRNDLTREEFKAIDKEWWELVIELYRNDDRSLRMLGYSEFNTYTIFGHCNSCIRKDECPKRENLEEDEIIADCNMHRY